jgi:hypothetical protein
MLRSLNASGNKTVNRSDLVTFFTKTSGPEQDGKTHLQNIITQQMQTIPDLTKEDMRVPAQGDQTEKQQAAASGSAPAVNYDAFFEKAMQA